MSSPLIMPAPGPAPGSAPVVGSLAGVGQGALLQALGGAALGPAQLYDRHPVAAVDRHHLLEIVDPLPLLALVPWTGFVAGALRGVDVGVGERRHALQLARREVLLDGVERLLERLLMRDLARHQEAQRVLDAGIVGDADQPLVDDLGAALGGEVGAQVAGRIAARIDVGGGPRHARRVGERWAAAEQDGLGVAVAARRQRAIELGLLHRRLAELRLHALVQHGDDRADHLKVAEFLGRDVEQHVLAPGIVLGQPLREVAHRGGEFPVGSAELLEQQRCQRRVRFPDAHRVLQPLVVNEHERHSLVIGAAKDSHGGERATMAASCGLDAFWWTATTQEEVRWTSRLRDAPWDQEAGC